MTLPGRPCLLQECSVGYSRAEDGHAVRSYLFEHQTPQDHHRRRAYEHNDPAYFQRSHAFQVQGLVEMFRRVEHRRVCGILLFSFETWFTTITTACASSPCSRPGGCAWPTSPCWPTPSCSAGTFTRAGRCAPQVTLINDDNGGRPLHAPTVEALLTADGRTLARAELVYGEVPYFATVQLPLELQVPAQLPAPCTAARLVLNVWEQGRLRSRNNYDLLLAQESWAVPDPQPEPVWYLPDDAAAPAAACRPTGCRPPPAPTLCRRPRRAGVCWQPAPDRGGSRRRRRFVQAGGRAVLVNQRDLPAALTGGKPIRYTEDATEIVTMNVPESPRLCRHRGAGPGLVRQRAVGPLRGLRAVRHGPHGRGTVRPGRNAAMAQLHRQADRLRPAGRHPAVYAAGRQGRNADQLHAHRRGTTATRWPAG